MQYACLRVLAPGSGMLVTSEVRNHNKYSCYCQIKRYLNENILERFSTLVKCTEVLLENTLYGKHFLPHFQMSNRVFVYGYE